jgi:hypothetical protein
MITLRESEFEKIREENHPNFSKGAKLIKPELLNFGEIPKLGSIDKNGIMENKKTIQAVSLNPNENNQKDSSSQLKRDNYNNYKFSLNFNKNNNISGNNKEKSKLLESNKSKFKELEDFSKISGIKTYINENNKHLKLYNESYPKYTLITKLFLNLNYRNNNINRKKFIFIEKEKNNEYKSKSCEASDLKSSSEIKTIIIKNDNSQIEDDGDKENEIRNSDKINNYNIQDDFLINYIIKEINIKNAYAQKNEIPSCIKLQDMRNFINDIFKNIKDKNSSKNGLKKTVPEFIEYLNFDSYKQRKKTFLQKKRKIFHDLDEIDDIEGEFNKNKKKPLNNRNKNINNNKKDGKKICVYLNQFKVNKSNLEIFPFFPSLINKENTKIKFLKGIVQKKYLIRINRKEKLIKDKRNLDFIINKGFNIIYQENNSNNYIVLKINGFQILYLILYYYYKIKEGISEINKRYYSHKSFDEIKEPIKQVEKLIKQCNKLVKNIAI